MAQTKKIKELDTTQEGSANDDWIPFYNTSLDKTEKQTKSDMLSTKQDISEKSQPNGYASLDNDGKVPLAELPPLGGGGGMLELLSPVATLSNDAENLTWTPASAVDFDTYSEIQFVLNGQRNDAKWLIVMLINGATSGYTWQKIRNLGTGVTGYDETSGSTSEIGIDHDASFGSASDDMIIRGRAWKNKLSGKIMIELTLVTSVGKVLLDATSTQTDISSITMRAYRAGFPNFAMWKTGTELRVYGLKKTS
jgi:hypothetical protein